MYGMNEMVNVILLGGGIIISIGLLIGLIWYGYQKEKLSIVLTHTAVAATIILPVFLTHFRGIADGLISYIALTFLLYCIVYQQWEWTKQLWVILALSWWGWMIICTIPLGPVRYGENIRIIQAILLIRFILFIAALQVWVLVEAKYRRWLAYVIGACAVYIIAQMLCQAIIGYNFFGTPRYFDGTLTGPYTHPRATAPLSRILLPIVLVACTYLFYHYNRKGWKAYIFTTLLLIFATVIIVLAGQRMPFMLFIFGLLISIIWLRNLRIIALITIVIIPVLVLITAFVSPRSFYHLVTHFLDQMAHFRSSPYGLVYIRATIMGLMNPWAGLGYDAFKYACGDPIYFHGWPLWDPHSGNGGGSIICLTHPHNHYLQAFIDGGFFGLLLFIILVVTWLRNLCIGLSVVPMNLQSAIEKSWRVGLFAAVFIHEWPLSSTSNFINMPLGGWFFLLLGMGLAYSWDYQKRTIEQSVNYDV